LPEFKNPNQQGGGDNKSLLVVMIVMVAVFFGLQYYRAKTNPATVPPNAAAATPNASPNSSPAGSQAAASPGTPVSEPGPGLARPSAANHAAPVTQASAESTTVIENELYRITFTNRGAQVSSWILKNFKDSDGKPLNLVHPQAAKLFGYPMSLYTYDGASVSIASASRRGNLITATTAGSLPAGINGQTVAIAGVSDKTYNGTYVVTATGPKTFTYLQGNEEAPPDSSTSGGTVSTVNGAVGLGLSQALFVPSATGNVAAPATVTFKYSNGDVQATKTFSFDETYVLHADVEVTRNGSPLRALLSWPGGFGDQNDAQSYGGAQFDNFRNGKDDHVAAKKVSGGDTINGPFDWAGVSDPFFAAIFLPENPETSTLATLNNQMDVAKTIHRTGLGSGSPAKGSIEVPILGAAIGDTGGHTLTRIYAGPKAISVLKAVHAENPKVTLEPLLEFGFWGLIGKYLFLSLQFIHNHMVAEWSGSWGWSIIILTVLINILMLPFRVKTMQNGLKMQRIQPQMNEIKEKYKKYKATDPKKNEMNAEIMKLQKDNGVNMFGGCIPTLITLPLLYAFFTMLPRVVELRQAHWLWLPDLQSPDPWHILPIAMVLSQFLVQFYTPSPGVDPQQQKMMAFMMPAISGYFTWTYGSGLALYWAVGNLISIAQQAVMNRTSLGREMREIAAKRARRKTGTGVTIKAKR
jgi:YidC/Oxa1 family membrane protein insertase